MTTRILALHRIDLATAQQLADQLASEHGSRPLVTVLDPVLHHHAITQGLTEVRLLPLPDADVAVGAAARAQAATRLLQAQCDALLAEVLPEAAGCGWLAHWLRQLHTTAYGFGRIGQLLGQTLAQRQGGEAVALLMADLPHRYGYHSMLPALKVADGLRQHGLAPRLYQTALQPWEAPLLPDPMRADAASPAAADAPELLVHLPTCFYDHALFAAELAASGRSALVLPAQLFDVATPALPRCTLSPPEALAAALTPAQRQDIAQLLPRLMALLQPALLALLGAAGPAQRQAQALVDSVQAQLLLFHALQRRWSARPPRALVISNHDSGAHGALLAFARRHRLPVLCLPHSKVHNQRLMSNSQPRLLCLHHALQGGAPTDLDDQPVATGVLDYAEPIAWPAQAPRPLATLGIVLNGLSANAMCLVDLRHYLRELQRLRDWAQARGVACRIRCRPNESVATVLVAELGLSARALIDDQSGSLLDFAQGCDLVLGYDQPTSGSIELLRHGVPLLQTACRALAPEEWRIVNRAIVPQLTVDDALQQLQRFHDAPLALWTWAQQQRLDYAQAQRGSRPLRAWIDQVCAGA